MTTDQLLQQITRHLTENQDQAIALINTIKTHIHQHSPQKNEPIDNVIWVPHQKVSPNDYNPNSVARVEMGLLLRSITYDGYTQPIVTIYDHEKDVYVIIDGFHRYYTMKQNQELQDRCNGYLPIVVLNKNINERMAATVRHNRARGKHSVNGMANMVFQMLDNGMADDTICNELGMEPEELLRLKHITGFSKLFEDHEYRQSWVTKNQIQVKHEYLASLQLEADPVP
jgi:ParB-like chromosome segregation protein Spo0J